MIITSLAPRRWRIPAASSLSEIPVAASDSSESAFRYVTSGRNFSFSGQSLKANEPPSL